MKKMILSLVMAMMASSAFAAGPVYDVCEKQLNDYVTNTLGTTVTGIHWIYHDRAGTEAAVSVASCNGTYMFRFRANEMTCHIAHYGTIPNYIEHVWTYGECSTQPSFSAMAVEIPSCPIGTMPVAQYNSHFEFIGYVCERTHDTVQ